MDNFATLPEAERRDILQEAANRRGLLPIIMEKDFWVCWTLKRLFEHPKLAPYVTFKGGTSLSKAYGLIERFSEDIDLTISRDAPHVTDGESPMEEGISGKERKRRIEALRHNARLFVEKEVLPHLEAGIRVAFRGTENWELVLDTEDPDQQTILFYYPKALNYEGFGDGFKNAGYIQPQIKLEFGARGETEPREPQTISPYVIQPFPSLFVEKAVLVPTLAAERSFWEKVTILHALYHGAKLRDRTSRHYYDTYMMAQKGIAEAALSDLDLLERVVTNKSLLFRDPKASYETAEIGSLRLVPGEEFLTSLKRDYTAMSEMFMGEHPDFETLIAGLSKLESRINQSSQD